MNTETATIASPQPAKLKIGVRKNFREYGLMVALIAIMIFFQVATHGTLFKPLNLTNVVLQNSYIVIMALGMLLVIVSGHIDLSVGSVAGFIGALAAIMMVRSGINSLLAAILCLIVGAAVGAAQGYWIAYHKIPSFIVTLSGMLVFRGLTLALLGGNSVGPFPREFQLLSSGFIPDPFARTGFRVTTMAIGALIAIAMFGWSLRTRLNRQKHGFHGGSLAFFVLENAIIACLILYLSYQLASYQGLPNVLIVMGLLISLFTFITLRTTVGRRIYAQEATKKQRSSLGSKPSG